jgi:LDH2 family malate/lactate/ureidoglycolate dehydrogenase
MDAILKMLKATPPAPGGDRVLVPGEIELANETRARAEGIVLAAAIAGQLAQFGEPLGVPFPRPLEVPARS